MSTVNKNDDRGTLQHATAQRLITKDSCVHELYISCKKEMPPIGMKVLGYVPASRRWFSMCWIDPTWSTGFSEYSQNSVTHWIDIGCLPSPRSKGRK